MPLFENAFCPVCNRKFEEGDDVVYCPECGTPHHRECYKAVGHCVNRGLHASGYSFYDEMKATQSPAANENVMNNESAHSLFQKSDEENEAPFNPFVPAAIQFDAVYEKDEEKICGESVADFASAIRTNIPRFINIFKEFESGKRKTSWNWGAFFFGSLYLFFRKIYKYGVAFFCSTLAILAASFYATVKFAPNYVEAVKNFTNLYAQNKATPEDVAALSKISDMANANIIVYISIALIIILRIVLALYADKIYKATICEFIKSVNSQLKDGATFVQASIFPSQGAELDSQQMKRYYLARRGGTTIFLPIVATSVAYFMISMISYTIFS